MTFAIFFDYPHDSLHARLIASRWVYARIQPIAIRNVHDYLLAALDRDDPGDRVFEIGGADVITYGEMLTGYARVRGLRRWLLPVPVLTPWLSSLWVHLVTPIPSVIARPLVEGMRNDVVVRDDRARRVFPEVRPVDYATAVRHALEKLQAGEVETTWADALATSQGTVAPVLLTTHEGMILEQRQVVVGASPEDVFASFTRLGGREGWLYWDWAWRLRGILDRLVGGVGLRRGRRDPVDLRGSGSPRATPRPRQPSRVATRPRVTASWSRRVSEGLETGEDLHRRSAADGRARPPRTRPRGGGTAAAPARVDPRVRAAARCRR